MALRLPAAAGSPGCPQVPALSMCQLDAKTVNAANSFKRPSAMGERQMLAVQIRRICFIDRVPCHIESK